MKEKRIGLFGGTFNPIHLGHLRAADIVLERFSLDQILFIPSYIPPHKDSVKVASPLHRLKMIELATGSNQRFVPSSIEIDAKGKSYSIITLNKVKEIYPEAQIFFILGIDTFLEIDTWKDYEKVLEKCFFIVISRPGYKLEKAKEILRKKYSDMIREITRLWDIRKENFSHFKIFLFSIDALDIASSRVREKINEKVSIKGLVPDSVIFYIEENKLYQGIK